MLLDTQKIETIMTILVLSSLTTVIMVFFCLWFLSRWVEIKELLVRLLKKFDETYVEQKSEKLKSIYVKQNFTEDATLKYEPLQTTQDELTTKSTTAKTTTIEIPNPIFEEDVTTTTTAKNPITTDDIKELIKKKKINKK